MISCLERLLNEGYNIFASYRDDQSLKNIPDKIKQSKHIKFFKLNLSSENKQIIETLKKNQIKADVIINAIGGSFGIKEYPVEIESWQKILDLNILKHILINNYFLDDMKKRIMDEFCFFLLQR